MIYLYPSALQEKITSIFSQKEISIAYLKLTYTYTERGKNSVYDGTLNDMMPFAFKLLNFEVFFLGSKIKCMHF